MRRYLLGGILLLFWCVPQVRGQILLKGLVVDAQTEKPLSAAHIQVEETNQGTITNTEGRFELILPALPVRLSIRFIGYQTERLRIEQDTRRDLVVQLQPAVIEMDELFVTGEDFTTNLMRRVIEEKQTWAPYLTSYYFEGYSKVVLETAERIILFNESVFDTYWDLDRGYREVIVSWRKTADYYDRLQIHPAGFIPNLYDDNVEIQGVSLIGPTHPLALEYYTFSLGDQRAMDDQIVYDIYIAPKTLLYPTFIGRISIVDGTYTMVEAELRPSRHVTYPAPVQEWETTYSQQFARFEDVYWMPVDLRLEGQVSIDVPGLEETSFDYQQMSRLSGYQINIPVPDSLYASEQRLSVDEQSVTEDYLFLMGRNIVPLTPREAEMLESARRTSPPTLEEAILGPGLAAEVAAFESARYVDDEPQFRWPRLLGWVPWLWFNRVDGYAVGFTRYLLLPPRLFGELRLAQTTGRGRVRMRSMLQYRWGRGYLLEGGYTANTDSRNRSSIYPLPINTLPGRLGQGDYFDYYWNKKTYLKAGYRFQRIRFNLSYHLETHRSAASEVVRVWPLQDTLRANPSIDEGLLQTVQFSATYGDGYKPLRVDGIRRIEVRVERSLPETDYSFTRFQLLLDWRLKTLFRNRLQPNVFDIRLFAGTYKGTLPVQRLGVLDGSLGPFGTLGVFRALRGRPYEGEQYVGAFWEHDFSTLPFEWAGLNFLVNRNTGLRVFGAHGRTWISDDRLQQMTFVPPSARTFHHEVGLSLTNIFGSPIRFDVTYRLDRPGFFLGFGLTRFD